MIILPKTQSRPQFLLFFWMYEEGFNMGLNFNDHFYRILLVNLWAKFIKITSVALNLPNTTEHEIIFKKM